MHIQLFLIQFSYLVNVLWLMLLIYYNIDKLIIIIDNN